MNDLIHLHADDNIAVASRTIDSGTVLTCAGLQFQTRSEIRIGHKIAIREIEKGSAVRKYGQIIGYTTQDLTDGEWVHSHNMVNGDVKLTHEKSTQIPKSPSSPIPKYFQGIRRPNGKAGTRNFIAIVSTVNCSATVSKMIARHFDAERLAEFPNVDGVIALTHDTGCGMKLGGQKHQMLNRVMAGFARHPNVGAYLIIGLGCEQATPGKLISDHQLIQIGGGVDSDSLPVFSMQDLGGTRKTVAAGIARIESILPIANQVERTSIPVSEIILGTECGGSDGNSGVTANPALGVASDLIVAQGGTSILAETSEIYGAEHLLTRRARTPAIADKLLDLIEWWKNYVGMFGEELDNNPSVGNKAGGLTTIAEKSLGAIAKAGSTALEEVYQYAEPVSQSGLVIMDSPGFDPPSVTGMVAGGANVVCFTTGRGSCFGCKPVPTIKIASNTPMYQRMEEDMDIDAGTILDGESVATVGKQIFDKIISVANGQKTKSELLGLEMRNSCPGPSDPFYNLSWFHDETIDAAIRQENRVWLKIIRFTVFI